MKKGVLRNFTKFTGKHLRQSLFFNKIVSCNFIKKETLAQVISCEFCEISKSTFFTEQFWTTASGSLKEARLLLLKIRFLISSGVEYCGDFKATTN